ncbi:hypothetical protein D0T49_05315 [Paludibacter sp. 221]|uniref:hypothetical protein n=1 Tax=Paludibacter sp. 221 TaxID=2302939 RepID=UPI0013D65965|nr:hypothetical protein [Paludibacter sp. 221]NDV46459.1 hypothetical protein [Paludibacter sp. 221]
MQHIKIEIKGVSAELALGNYMPKDPTIYENWEDFYHYDDIIHESLLLSEYVNELTIFKDGEQTFKGHIPASQFKAQKSISPVMEQGSLYLRTECVENAVYTCEFDVEEFDITKLFFETQDYDSFFKVGKSFITNALYDGKVIKPEWQSAVPVGNICLLCRFENGYLIPQYDAVGKKSV